jgi:hypothetical protein
VPDPDGRASLFPLIFWMPGRGPLQFSERETILFFGKGCPFSGLAKEG